MSSMKQRQRAVRRDLLERSFSSARLGLKVLGGPIDARSQRIVQLDIRDSPSFGEYFRIWPGAEANEIEVVEHDHRLRQLVLRVQEAPQPVVRELPKLGGRAEAEARARSTGGRVVGEHGNRWVIEHLTAPPERRFLCGHDDVRMFIAAVPPGTSAVSSAHARLRPMLVTEAERRQPGSVVRQGEWFFVPIDAGERAGLEAHLATHPRLPLRDQRLGKTGRPHLAEEQVVMHRRGTYARGAIRHIGHNTLVLPDWRRVLHNLEGPAGDEERRRLKWLD